jgi:hypothetical protein
MDFENILPAIFVLIYVFSLFMKKKKSQDGSSKPKKPGALRRALGEMVTQIKTEMEAAKRPPSGDDDVWGRLEPEREVSIPTEAELFMHDTSPPPLFIKSQPEAREMSKKVVDSDFKDAYQIATQSETEDGSTDTLFQNLQKAIVWSEILASPMALRDGGNDGWRQ